MRRLTAGLDRKVTKDSARASVRCLLSAAPPLLALLMLLSALPSTCVAQPAANGGQLPKDFAPRQKTPPVMTIEKPLMTEAQETTLKKEQPRFSKALSSGSEDPIIKRGAEYLVNRMSMKKYRRELPDVREEILRPLRLSAKDLNPARRQLLKELTNYAAGLLDNQFHVRLNAVILLSQLNLKEAAISGDPPAVAYAPAAVPLLAVINDKTQLDAIKVQAVNGLTRICTTSDPADVSKYKVDVAKAFAADLARADSHWWYQMRLAEGLGKIGVSIDPQNRQAFVRERLQQTMADKNREWLVQCEAAKSLGRIPTDPAMPYKDIAVGIVSLCARMTADFNKNPKRFGWELSYTNLYLAFKPIDAAERNKKAGLLQKSTQPIVRQAYDSVLPVVVHVRNVKTTVPAELINKMSELLKKEQAVTNQGAKPPIAAGPAAAQ